MTLFSKRNRRLPPELRHDVPRDVRSRILYAIQSLSDGYGSTFQLGAMLDDVRQSLLVAYGGLCAPGYDAARVSSDPLIEHFFSCDDEMALDFIEACFQAFHNPGRAGVDAINAIFQDAAIGYELTPYVETITNKPGTLFGRRAGKLIEITRPKIIKRDSQYLHTELTTPALALLSDDRFKGANDEFLNAHTHYRHGRYKECLNDCLKAFESTMKSICHLKHWTTGSGDTAKTLIKICLDNGLVPAFSQQQLTSLRSLLESGVPTVRNKTSGHGQGVEVKEVPQGLAKYALSLTAATIILFVESAN